MRLARATNDTNESPFDRPPNGFIYRIASAAPSRRRKRSNGTCSGRILWLKFAVFSFHANVHHMICMIYAYGMQEHFVTHMYVCMRNKIGYAHIGTQVCLCMEIRYCMYVCIRITTYYIIYLYSNEYQFKHRHSENSCWRSQGHEIPVHCRVYIPKNIPENHCRLLLVSACLNVVDGWPVMPSCPSFLRQETLLDCDNSLLPSSRSVALTVPLRSFIGVQKLLLATPPLQCHQILGSKFV